DYITSSKEPVILWAGPKKDLPVIIFRPELTACAVDQRYKSIGDKFHMAYKVMCDCKLIHQVLTAHGFREAHPNSSNFNIMWTGSHLKPYLMRGLLDYQRINHFPRSYEVTRKDRMFKNVQRMQHQVRDKTFDFVPKTFVLPEEYNEFYATFKREKGLWIVKPIASSRGRGIFLVSQPNQVPLDEKLVVSRYVRNPYCIDGYKFDIRLYVLVTSYDPLVIYLYKEGLTRFATMKYDNGVRNINKACMHLTNYSINKKSNDYIRCEDPNVEDFGNKWSMSAMLRYLNEYGEDTTALMIRIEDVIIKTIISAELPIATACKSFLPHRRNCFEIYGFDILVDEDLRPWVLEVNLSPSLACDTPMDFKIKSSLICDTFNIIGEFNL
ncbi:uncharacterized protein TRIADDRAFT_27246, partial [Trichoplax adhaerens]